MSPSFEDIDSKVEKAQGDKARFLKSKEGLLPHFEFPSGETKEEKHYSKETLLADMYEERLEEFNISVDEKILNNVFRYIQNREWEKSDEKENMKPDNSAGVLKTFSALINTNSLSRRSSEEQRKAETYLHDKVFIVNAYDHAKSYTHKKGFFYSPRRFLEIISALISTGSLFELDSEYQKEVEAYLHNPVLLEDIYQEIQKKIEGKQMGDATDAFRAISAIISTNVLPQLSPENQKRIKTYLCDPIFFENVCKDIQAWVNAGNSSVSFASQAIWNISSLIIVKDYLREKGKKIDDETFAKEALNPTKKIPPRPEMRNNH